MYTLRSRGLPRPSWSSRPASTAARHCTKSLRTVSRRDNVRSLRLRKSWSRELVRELVLSRVLIRSRPVELFSLRMAAASRSGQSDRLTNSNCGSLTSVTGATALRLPVEESGLGRSKASTSSFSLEGLGALSLNKSKEAATLRPIPAFELGGTTRSGLEEEEDATGEGDLRSAARRAVVGDIGRKSSAFLGVREEGMVIALSEVLRVTRWWAARQGRELC